MATPKPRSSMCDWWASNERDIVIGNASSQQYQHKALVQQLNLIHLNGLNCSNKYVHGWRCVKYCSKGAAIDFNRKLNTAVFTGIWLCAHSFY